MLDLQAPPANWRDMVGGSRLEAELLWYGLAPATRRSYEKHALDYSYFAQLHNLPTPYFPVPGPSVSAWIAWEANQIIANGGMLFEQTLQRKVGGLRSWHVDLGFEVDLLTPRVKRVIAGAVRKWGTNSREQPLPITMVILSRISDVVRRRPDYYGGHLCALALRTAFVLAFACFLRKSEFTYDTFNGALHVSRGSVSFSRDGSRATLHLPASKTDAKRKGVNIPIPTGRGDLCPVRLLRQWFAECPAEAQSPLFSFNGRPFSGTRFVNYLRQALGEAGYDGSAYSGHSFRSGAATWAASIGIPSDKIQIMGRWSSDAYRLYIRTPAAEHLAAASGLLTTPPSKSSLPANGVPHRNQVWAPMA